MNNDKHMLVLFGGAPGTLGGSFHTYAARAYRTVRVFDLHNGFDCTDPRVMQVVGQMIDDAMEQTGCTDLHVVNFVGMMDNGKIVDYDNDAFRRIMFVNIYSLFVIAQNMIPLLQKYNGRFITMGSNAAELGFTGMSAYCATKHAAHGFIKCMAKELAPYDVPVNIVNPGAFEPSSSKMSQVQVDQFVEQTGTDPDGVLDMLSSRIPMKRLATNIDLNRVLFALLNTYPRYYTGQAVSLNGGMTMR